MAGTDADRYDRIEGGSAVRKPLILAALLVGVAAVARKRSNAKAADAALWHEATTGPASPTNGSKPAGT